jgi:hypothetical protein
MCLVFDFVAAVYDRRKPDGKAPAVIDRRYKWGKKK